MYANRLKLYIGGYYWQMNGADSIVFTDSIGTASWKLRDRICGGVESLGIEIDRDRNRLARPNEESIVSEDTSDASILVISTDEEQVILKEVLRKWQPDL